MLPPRACESLELVNSAFIADTSLDFFIGLNAIRALSIISMLLVFASSIFVLVKDVEAVNYFMKNSGDEDLLNCDYIEYVGYFHISRPSSLTLRLPTETAPYRTSPQACSGLS